MTVSTKESFTLFHQSTKVLSVPLLHNPIHTHRQKHTSLKHIQSRIQICNEPQKQPRFDSWKENYPFFGTDSLSHTHIHTHTHTHNCFDSLGEREGERERDPFFQTGRLSHKKDPVLTLRKKNYPFFQTGRLSVNCHYPASLKRLRTNQCSVPASREPIENVKAKKKW